MLHFYEVHFGIRIRQNIGLISSVKPKKYMSRFVTMKVVHSTESSTLSFLNVMLMYILSRIPGKHKSTLKFFKIYLDRKDFKQSIN